MPDRDSVLLRQIATDTKCQVAGTVTVRISWDSRIIRLVSTFHGTGPTVHRPKTSVPRAFVSPGDHETGRAYISAPTLLWSGQPAHAAPPGEGHLGPSGAS